MLRLILAALCLLFMTAHVSARDGGNGPFDETADARAEVDAALAAAEENGNRVLLVFGANWCHDSHGLADHFAQADLAGIIADHYELVLIDVGWRHRNLGIARDYGVPTIYGTPTVLVIDPELGLLNRDTMHTWHTAYSRPHDDVVRYFRLMAFTLPGGGVVENTQTYAALVEDIEDWEHREGTRLSEAYVMLQNWRATLDDEFAAARTDTEAALVVANYHSVEAAIDRHRGRMREDRNALFADAREAVRDALFELGSDLTPELAAELDAARPDIRLDFPDYGDVRFPWEEDDWEL